MEFQTLLILFFIFSMFGLIKSVVKKAEEAKKTGADSEETPPEEEEYDYEEEAFPPHSEEKEIIPYYGEEERHKGEENREDPNYPFMAVSSESEDTAKIAEAAETAKTVSPEILKEAVKSDRDAKIVNNRKEENLNLEHPPPRQPTPDSEQRSGGVLLGDLRRAIILSEIISPPLSLREPARFSDDLW